MFPAAVAPGPDPGQQPCLRVSDSRPSIVIRTVNTIMNSFPGSDLRQGGADALRSLGVESRYVVPRFVERTSQGVREYDPYAKLFEERVIFLGVQVDDASANDVMAQLLCLESMDPDRDISIYINSPGGSFTALTAIYDTMQFVKPDIQTVCMGQAASAAAVLLAAGTPGKRMALPNARVLIHQPSSETGRAQLSDLEIAANEILRMRSQLEELLAKHSNTPIEQVRDDIERDKILTAEEALSYGLVDQIISTRKSSAAV
jgi:ATP-dependent Clp protease protease subunit